MLLISILSKRTTQCVSCSLSQACRARFSILPLRRQKPVVQKSPTVTAKTPPKSDRTPIFPEKLIVYHSGTAKAAIVGILKVSTLLILSFFALVAAPAFYQSESQQNWIAPAVALSGAIPMIFVFYISAPFVTNIHIRIPHYARFSRQILLRYSQTLPKDALLDITMVNSIGMPRRTVVRMSELYPTKERFGMVNYVRDTTEINARRPWYLGKAVRQFGIHGGVRLRNEMGVWERIAKTIEKRRIVS